LDESEFERRPDVLNSKRLRLLVASGLAALAASAVAGIAIAASGHGHRDGPSSAAQYQYGPAAHQYGGKGAGRTKAALCHKGHSITVGQPAAAAHLKHGDATGPCPQNASTAVVHGKGHGNGKAKGHED
jgi:hypothetical protein